MRVDAVVNPQVERVLGRSAGPPSVYFAQSRPTALRASFVSVARGVPERATVLNWNIATPVDLTRWPAVQDYYVRLKRRPSIARALTDEHALYAAEMERHKAA
jgi:glutathione S-transferase